ncbi:hypothetical protein [Streptomyces lasiicapitis]|uniref:DUF1795 domain-containing protein n=1 Tax=Streptomyces lasiicapitis TaxID=1923961 RepID=A0ABQ2LI40_9ACTN|nr:hypothetical protein [Streptomyces lasiicapitis]GGO34791.1 hypothetical protein GCM10012286_04430 [Streptomyces lasiicapitis]
MAATLPVPMEGRLPEGWHPASPGQVGAPDVAFVALRPPPDAGFTSNITVDGEYRPDGATLAEIADESVRSMCEVADSVTVDERHEVGSADAPALTQVLSFSAVTDGVRRDLAQTQIYLAMLDINDPSERAVIRLTLTTTTAQHSSVLGDFQQFIRSVRPDTGMV